MESKRFTIVGKPVSHSKSPDMFAAAYAAYPQFTYDKSETESAECSVTLLKLKYSGGNITAPYKEGVLRLADEVSEEALFIGAVNCAVVLPDGRLSAFNTDHIGISESFREFGVSLKGKKCLLLGAGGAGKATAYSFMNAGAKLTVANRSAMAAEALAKKTGANFVLFENRKELMKSVSEADIIMNTLYPDIDIIDENLLQSGQTVFDASYIGSKLLVKAQARNCKCIDGRYWVYNQALPCFLKFTGIDPDKDSMRKVLGI